VTIEPFTREISEGFKLHPSGVLRELYFTADPQEAVLVLECDSSSGARRRLAELPLILNPAVQRPLPPV